MMNLALGVDIGGTNTAFGVVDQEGNILFESVTPTRNHDSANTLVTYIYDVLKTQNLHDKIVGICAGAPNGNHYTGNIEFAPNLHWTGIVPLAQIFSDQFGCRAILTNDANAAAVGEMLFGVAKGLTNFVTITLGTGLGSGVIINGNVVYGEYGFAGEYGHIRVIPDGRTCACGRKGCLETYASATGVVRSIQELNSPNKKHSALIKLKNPTSKDVSDAAEQGDEFAIEIIEYTAQILGSALADFMCFSNPKAFILFGGLAHAGQLFAERVKHYMEEGALKIYENRTEIFISELQDKNAAVLGTAAIVFQNC